MNITYKCDRIEPNDLEKKAIEKVFKKNVAELVLKSGDYIVLPHETGAIFFNKHGVEIEVVDFIFTENIISVE